MGEPGEGPERELEEGVRRIRGALDRLPAAGREATRADRRLEKRLREEDEASVPHAFVFGAVAAFVGATQPHLFWLLFVALAADSAAAEVTRESLKGGLEALGAEVDAVAKALEEVHGVGSAAPAALPSPGASAAVRAAARQAGST